MELRLQLSHDSDVPLYRQVYEQLAQRIQTGELARGDRLPATRELAGLLGLNRTTVSTAYEMLEADRLIAGQVGRGSFVTGPAPAEERRVDWDGILPPANPLGSFAATEISFVMSRPSRDLFPLVDFRASC